jgi:tRNA (guanine37-N1)-methyltransferase
VWRATALSLFPEMFPGPLGESLAGRALAEGVWSLAAIDIRRFARDRHGTVDDAPFGGGAGMVMKPDVLSAAIEAAAQSAGGPGVPKILLSPRGAPFTQARGRELAQGPGVVLVCGRFEGVDERVIEAQALEEISVGDFVLSGGEIAAMAVMDCCVRLLPGVMGEPASANEESFEDGLLEYPHYTRPANWTGPDGIERRVPEILVSGHHGKVAAWRRQQREEITRRRRPDLWALRQAARMNQEK